MGPGCLLVVASIGCGSSGPPPSANLEPPPSEESSVELTGMYNYMADAALFVDCATGKRYPVSMEADNLALEKAYLSLQTEPNERILVTLRGHYDLRPPMEGDADIEKMIPDRFGQFWPGEECLTEQAP